MGTRHSFSGNAIATTLSANIGTGDTTVTVGSTSGWPNTAIGPFVITVDKGNSNEEKMLVSAYTGGTLTIATRGYDGTVAASHTSGAAVVHTIDATSYGLHDQVVNGVGTVTPGNSAVGDVAADGTSILPAAADHTHGRESFGTGITASAPGDATGGGSATTPARSDHKHAREAWGITGDFSTNPTGGIAAVAAVAGSTGRTADAGHTHAVAKRAAFSVSPDPSNIAAGATYTLPLTGAGTTMELDTYTALSSSGYTIPNAGLWRIRAQVAVYGSNSNTNCHISIDVNGTAKRKGVATAGPTPDYVPLVVEHIYNASAGDVITVTVTNDSGNGLQIVTTDGTLNVVAGEQLV